MGCQSNRYQHWLVLDSWHKTKSHICHVSVSPHGVHGPGKLGDKKASYPTCKYPGRIQSHDQYIQELQFFKQSRYHYICMQTTPTGLLLGTAADDAIFYEWKDFFFSKSSFVPISTSPINSFYFGFKNVLFFVFWWSPLFPLVHTPFWKDVSPISHFRRKNFVQKKKS
jgi:hypothetical protein